MHWGSIFRSTIAGVNSTASKGEKQWGKWVFEPVGGVQGLTDDEAKAKGAPMTFAMTFPPGTHAMWTRYWLAAGGINPDKDVTLITIPPPQMVANMKVDKMDGFCVGEPWNARAIADGRADRKNNPLKNAPHTVEDLVGEWNRPYTREQACFPPGAFRVDKYWPPVNRIDNVYGDRHLVCTCPPLDAYMDAAE